MDRQADREDVSGTGEASVDEADNGMPRISSFAYDGAGRTTTYTYSYNPGPPLYELEHLQEKGLFALVGPDGQTEYFRDRPARYLVVEADPETGEFAPVVKNRRPVLLWLCREEREVR
jgi:hypothetical protein